MRFRNESRNEYRTFFWLILALGITYTLFVRTIGYDFTNWDDPWLVSQNPIIKECSMRSLSTIWLDLSPDTRHILGEEYLPVRDTATMVIHHYLGSYPVGYHATNLILYLFICTLLFFLLLHFSQHLPTVTLATLLFSLHPSHVESVAWVSEMKALLSLFFLLSGILFLLWRTNLQNRPLWQRLPIFLFAITSFSLSILSKSTGIAFLPLLLALGIVGTWDSIPTRIRRWTWGLFGLQTVLHISLTTQLGGEMGMYRQWMGGDLITHWMTIPTLLLKYFALLLFPWNVEILTKIEPINSPFNLPLILSLATIGAAAFLVYQSWVRSYRLFAVAGFCFLLALLPVLQLVPFVVRFASRFLFLPSVAVAFLWLALAEVRWDSRSRKALPVLGIGIALFFALRSNDTLPSWKNCESLWTTAASQGQFDHLVTANRYRCALGQGDRRRALHIVKKATRKYPSKSEYWVDLGRAYLLIGQPHLAESSFVRAQDLGLSHKLFENNLGVVRMAQERKDEADRIFQGILDRTPSDGTAWGNRGHIARKQHRWNDAIRFYRRSVLESPDSKRNWRYLTLLTNQFGSRYDKDELAAIQEEFPYLSKLN